MDSRAQSIAAILFEKGCRKRTPEETARFANLLDKQMARDRARQILLLAEYELNFAREVIDNPDIPFTAPAPTVESVEAEKAKEIADSERLMGYAAQAARQVLHAWSYSCEAEIKAVQELAVAIREKAPAGILAAVNEQDLSFAEWEVLARAAIVYLGTPQQEDR